MQTARPGVAGKFRKLQLLRTTDREVEETTLVECSGLICVWATVVADVSVQMYEMYLIFFN